MQPSLRVVIGVAVSLVAVGIVAVAIILFLAPRGTAPVSGPDESPAPSWAPPADPPGASATPGAGIASLPDADWVTSTAAATGIPPRALAAYAGAAMRKAEDMPECGVAWNTLAGIARVESDHGRHGGSTVGEDGTVTPPIYGPPLDGGEGVEHIPDSDDGAIDGSADIDRAAGPFQLIPQTWRNWHVDGGGDGVEDPQNIDDAALATVNYLCRVSTAMDTEEGWVSGISGFNSPASYRTLVARYAIAYATLTAPAG